MVSFGFGIGRKILGRKIGITDGHELGGREVGSVSVIREQAVGFGPGDGVGERAGRRGRHAER